MISVPITKAMAAGAAGVLTCISLPLAVGLRFDFDLQEIAQPHRLLVPLGLLAVIRIAIFSFSKIVGSRPRDVSVVELGHLLRSSALSSAVFSTAVFILRVPFFSRSVVAIEFVLFILLAGGQLVLARIVGDRREHLQRQDRHGKAILIGAGEAAGLVLRILKRESTFPFQVCGLLDDKESLQGARVYGLPVMGPISALSEILHENPSIRGVVCTISSLPEPRAHELSSLCDHFGVTFHRMRHFADFLLDGAESSCSADRLLEALLERSCRPDYHEEVLASFIDATVLVTGAGGSIGSEIVRQVLDLSPRMVIALDISELNLFNLRQSLVRQGTRDADVISVLGDVRSLERLNQVMSEHQPDIVIHAAAYKHINLVEDNPSEAFLVNSFGTLQVLRSASANGVRRCVVISSDKAVLPASVLGYTKRIAEILLHQFGSTNPNIQNLCGVRFGNVLDSTGSVVPVFREQIRAGLPLTITDTRMRRFFMSVEQAVQLSLTASSVESHGDIFVLEMGNPIRIVELAERMKRFMGRPDLPVREIGLRPGEKLEEDLVFPFESLAETRYPQVARVIGAPQLNAPLIEQVDKLAQSIEKINSEDLRQLLRSWATGRQTTMSDVMTGEGVSPEPIVY